MAIPESRKRANSKWDKENMTTLGCKIRKEQAADFKAYCEAQGKTSNTVLKDYVLVHRQATHRRIAKRSRHPCSSIAGSCDTSRLSVRNGYPA